MTRGSLDGPGSEGQGAVRSKPVRFLASTLALSLAAAAIYGPAVAQIRVPEIVIWNRIADIAARNLDQHAASRQFAQALADAGSGDPEMQQYLETSVEGLDRQIARDRALMEVAERIVAQESGSASDPKSGGGPVGEFLNDPKREAVSGPLKDYLERRQALSEDPKREMVSGPLRDWLAQQAARAARDATQRARIDRASDPEAGTAFNRVRVNGSLAALQSGRLMQEWTTIVVDSTGEVIIDDPRDAIEAKLADLGAELEQLRDDAAQAGEPEGQRDIRRRLAEIDREMKNAIEALSRLVSPTKIGDGEAAWAGRPSCKPRLPDTVSMGCSYWASNVPLTIPGGDPMIVEKVELEIVEADNGQPVAWSLGFWWRYQSDPAPPSQPRSVVGGDFELSGDGTLLMAPGRSSGVIDQGTFPLRLGIHHASAQAVDLLDQNHPMNLVFERDADDLRPARGRGETDYDATAYDPIPADADLGAGDSPSAPAPEDRGLGDEDLVPLADPDTLN